MQKQDYNDSIPSDPGHVDLLKLKKDPLVRKCAYVIIPYGMDRDSNG